MTYILSLVVTMAAMLTVSTLYWEILKKRQLKNMFVLKLLCHVFNIHTVNGCAEDM